MTTDTSYIHVIIFLQLTAYYKVYVIKNCFFYTFCVLFFLFLAEMEQQMRFLLNIYVLGYDKYLIIYLQIKSKQQLNTNRKEDVTRMS